MGRGHGRTGTFCTAAAVRVYVCVRATHTPRLRSACDPHRQDDRISPVFVPPVLSLTWVPGFPSYGLSCPSLLR